MDMLSAAEPAVYRFMSRFQVTPAPIVTVVTSGFALLTASKLPTQAAHPALHHRASTSAGVNQLTVIVMVRSPPVVLATVK